jgi:hypothetical protein
MADVGFPPSIEEEIPMTMQVGMVGTNGVLIASDTKWVAQMSPSRNPWHSTKFKVNYKCGVAIACAQSMETAFPFADEIIALSLENDNWRASPDFTIIQRLADKVLHSTEKGRERAQCLVAFTRPKVELCLFQIAKVNGEWGPVFHSITEGSVYAGDEGNQAKFLADRYYRHRMLPIENLIPLAAHLVLAAGELNSAMVDGLEIVLCDASGIRRLADASISKLKSGVAERDEMIASSLFNSSEQFI